MGPWTHAYTASVMTYLQLKHSTSVALCDNYRSASEMKYSRHLVVTYWKCWKEKDRGRACIHIKMCHSMGNLLMQTKKLVYMFFGFF